MFIPAPKEADQAKANLIQAKEQAKDAAADAKDKAVETKDKAASKIKSNEPNAMKFFADLAAGGTAGGLSKTVVAPIERVKLLLQTQDSNPRIKSGEIARYTGMPWTSSTTLAPSWAFQLRRATVLRSCLLYALL